MIWNLIARVLKNHHAKLLELAQRTPYFHLDGYMLRWWLVQPRKWLPFSSRFHMILRADDDRHMHDHPWQFRSIVLSGWYDEEKIGPDGKVHTYRRLAGYSHKFAKGDYHRISKVSPDGVLTLCIFGKKLDTWGFLVDGKRVNWREYLGISNDA